MMFWIMSCIYLKHIQYIELIFYTAEQVYTVVPGSSLVWQAGGAIPEDEYMLYSGAYISVRRQTTTDVTAKRMSTTKRNKAL